jgi:hypothetical protein
MELLKKQYINVTMREWSLELYKSFDLLNPYESGNFTIVLEALLMTQNI